MNRKITFVIGFFIIKNMISAIANPVVDPMSVPLCCIAPKFSANDTCEGYPIRFNNTTCYLNCDDYSFSWNFGDGSPIETQVATWHIYHTFLHAGTYSVTLTATYFGGGTPTTEVTSHTVTIRPFENCCSNNALHAIYSVNGVDKNTAYIGDIVSFRHEPDPEIHSGYEFFWNFGDNGIVYNDLSPTHIFSQQSTPGGYAVSLIGKYRNEATGKECVVSNFSDERREKLIISAASDGLGVDCCDGTFAPDTGKNYVLSAWVSSSDPYATASYTDASISIVFTRISVLAGPFYPKGPIIDGWQKIESEFTVPSEGVESIIVNLNNEKDNRVYFDDIRIFPLNGNMKSYVYDPLTKRLVAELDENNYATYYEYNEEGELVRVKKETERGRMTIKESRNSTVKTNQ